SRTRPRRSTCRIVGGRIQRCQRSVGSSGDSPPPRQIFTFTHLPLRSPFICHRGIECDDGADLFASSVACPRRGVGDARAHRPGSLHDVGLPLPVRGPSGGGRRVVQRSHPSRLRREPRFYEEMEKVASEAYRVLRFGGILAWIIADEYRGGIYTPVGFRLLGLLARRFEPIDTIVLVRHHDRSASPMWEHRARRFNFFLRGFKFLLLLRKPFDEPGG